MQVRHAAAIAATIWTSVATGAEYYVATTGNDTATGTAAAPWRTLQHAADVVGPGDRVVVRPGNYTGFYLSRSGTAAAPLEFFAEPGVAITQQNTRTPDGINLELASYVTIDGFSVSSMPRSGVRTVGNASQHARHVAVRNVTAANNQTWGIFTAFVDDLVIESNKTSGSVTQHGIYVSNSGDRPIIRNNVSFANRAAGIHMNGDINVGGDGIISGAVISGNRIYDNGLGGGSALNMDGVQNSRIENNLMYNNHASGISLFRIDGGGPSTGNVVINNTINEASNARWAINIQNASTGNKLNNNILLSEHATRGAINISTDSLVGFVSDYNVVIPRFTLNDGGTVLTLPQWQTQTGQDLHSLVSNAADLFVNASAGDYHLKSAAAAIDNGTNLLAPAADLDNKPRPQGSGYDIGAYEFATVAMSGDYNGNGAVDAADYVVWRNTLGQTVAPGSGADGDRDGVVTAVDHQVWRSSFGAPAGSAISGSAVPEPAIGIIVWSLLAGVRLQRQRWRN